MSEDIISKEEINKLMAMDGQTRGVAIKEHLDFILKEKGKKGLKKLVDTMVELGFPEYKEIKLMNFYPLGLYALTLLAIQRLFNFNDKKFEEMGKFSAKFSIVLRLLVRYFLSVEMAAKGASKLWRRYHTAGNLKIVEYDAKKKYVILRIENFSPLPAYCQMVKGYFSGIAEIHAQNKVFCEEKKCVFRGDEYHEFLLKW